VRLIWVVIGILAAAVFFLPSGESDVVNGLFSQTPASSPPPYQPSAPIQTQPPQQPSPSPNNPDPPPRPRPG
jgi:hypothetical protein